MIQVKRIIVGLNVKYYNALRAYRYLVQITER